MMKQTGNNLSYHHQAPWSLRRVVFAVASVSLAAWVLALVVVLG